MNKSPRTEHAEGHLGKEASQLVRELLEKINEKGEGYLALHPLPERLLLDLVIEKLQDAYGHGVLPSSGQRRESSLPEISEC